MTKTTKKSDSGRDSSISHLLENKTQVKTSDADAKRLAGNAKGGKAGRKYDKQLGEELCLLISEGASVLNACVAVGIAQASFYRWLYLYEDLREGYASARTQKADTVFDGMQAIEDQVMQGQLEPNAARVILDSQKWRLGKLAGKYSDKQTVDMNVTNNDTAVGSAPDWLKQSIADGKVAAAPAEEEESEQTPSTIQ